MEYISKIEKYINQLTKVLNRLDIVEIERCMQAIQRHREGGNPIYIFGNGGSAATASHFVCDFNKGASENIKQGFRFICLNDNVPIMTAIANDIGYESIFSYQLERKLEPVDLVIAISGSGNSLNIIKAVEYARSIGCKIVGITGFSGGRLKELADYSLHVPIHDMQKVEDIHMVFDHMIMQIFNEFV